MSFTSSKSTSHGLYRKRIPHEFRDIICSFFLYGKYVSFRIQDQLSFPNIIENGSSKGRHSTYFSSWFSSTISFKMLIFQSPNGLFADGIYRLSLPKLLKWNTIDNTRIPAPPPIWRTVLVIFRKRKKENSVPTIPPLRLREFQITTNDTAKFLETSPWPETNMDPSYLLLETRNLSFSPGNKMQVWIKT